MVSGQHSVNGRIAQRLADQMEHSIGTDHAPVDLEEYHVRELQWKRGDVTAIFLVEVDNRLTISLVFIDVLKLLFRN